MDLRIEPVAQPVERFTIVIEPQAEGAELRMSWDRTRASVPIRVKP